MRNNTNRNFPHDLVGITRVEIIAWPGGEGNAVVVEDKQVHGIEIEVDVADDEYWTYSKNQFPVLVVYSNMPRPRAERRMVVAVAPGKKHLVHFVQR